MKCKICNSFITSIFNKAKVLGKYKVSYYQCGICGFIQTEEPYWLKEAYSNAVGFNDIGLAGRNLIQVELTKTVVALFFSLREQYLDYGGGYGLFVRLMRDNGYNFFLFEPNCDNLFAKTFDVKLNANSKYNLITAFEVFEHLVDPLAEIEQILKLSPNIFFSTTLVPSPTPKPSQWWYYSLDGGQHISLYTKLSLSYLARKLGVRVYSNGRTYHLFTNKIISQNIFSLVTRVKISKIINQFFHQPSLLSEDYLKVIGQTLK